MVYHCQRFYCSFHCLFVKKDLGKYGLLFYNSLFMLPFALTLAFVTGELETVSLTLVQCQMFRSVWVFSWSFVLPIPPPTPKKRSEKIPPSNGFWIQQGKVQFFSVLLLDYKRFIHCRLTSYMFCHKAVLIKSYWLLDMGVLKFDICRLNTFFCYCQ